MKTNEEIIKEFRELRKAIVGSYQLFKSVGDPVKFEDYENDQIESFLTSTITDIQREMIEIIKKPRPIFFKESDALNVDRDIAVRDQLRKEILNEIDSLQSPAKEEEDKYSFISGRGLDDDNVIED